MAVPLSRSLRVPRSLQVALALALLGASLARRASADDPGDDGGIVKGAPRPATVTPSSSLARDWCVGRGPVSWGFSFSPGEPCREMHLRCLSSAVKVQSARRGPGMPNDWTVRVDGGREVVASGPADLPAGEMRQTFLVIETDRSTADASRQGATPVQWDAWLADSTGAVTPGGHRPASFPPVMDLSDATARGIVLTTVEGLGPSGPLEITVDNPTWQPIWLDLPAGSIVTGGGADWVTGLCAPFRMMKKQKTGRTVTAFPLSPGPATATPRRFAWSSRTHAKADQVRTLALAVQALQDRSRAATRKPGVLESAEPFDFWPLVLEWSVWQATASPAPELLQAMVSKLLNDRTAAGDPAAARVGVALAVADVQATSAEAAALHPVPEDGDLSLALQCARACFR